MRSRPKSADDLPAKRRRPVQHQSGAVGWSRFVLDGELRVFAGEEEHAAGSGTVAVLQRGVRHAHVVTSATARFLTLHMPGGFEQFAAEVGEPAEALTLPPEPAVPPDLAVVTQIAARHGITILAPPPQP